MRLTLLLVAWLPLAQLRAEDPTLPELEKLIRKSVERWKVPGAAVVVLRDEKLVHLQGYGVERLGETKKVTPDSRFPIASCTKAFTATLAAMTVDDKKIDWDESLRKRVEDYAPSDRLTREAFSLRDLLCHRSGIAGHDLLWFRAPWTLEETLRRASQLPPDAPFRGGFTYSSIPFIVAGKALEKSHGKNWEQLLEEQLLKPLDMTSTKAFVTEGEQGHCRTEKGEIIVMEEKALTGVHPAGSIRSTPRDMAKWVHFQLTDGLLPDGKRLIKAETLQETRTPQVVMRKDSQALRTLYAESKQVSYGLGWVVFDYRGELVVAHGGIAEGFRTQVTLLPEKGIGIVTFNNLHRSDFNIAVTYTLIDQLLGMPPREWDTHFLQAQEAERQERVQLLTEREKSRKANVVPQLPLSQYSGSYEHPAYGTATIVLEAGKLHWKWSSFEAVLEPYEGEKFRLTQGPYRDELLIFHHEGQRPDRFILGGMEYKRVP